MDVINWYQKHNSMKQNDTAAEFIEGFLIV